MMKRLASFVRWWLSLHSGKTRSEAQQRRPAMEYGAIEAQFFSGYGELDRLQKRIRRCAYVRVRCWCPVPEGQKSDLFDVTLPQREARTNQ
jgi:hypothetical protein